MFFFNRRKERLMSAIIDAINRNTASVDRLAAIIAALPPPVDEAAAVAAISANSDKIDALADSLTPKTP
jgi:hypothetical protein